MDELLDDIEKAIHFATHEMSRIRIDDLTSEFEIWQQIIRINRNMKKIIERYGIMAEDA